LLIIGSAAGVVAMGMEKISFGWYLKNISFIAFLGYVGGIVSMLLF
jgi:Na+/H+ antiporter NhaD/arsenite permease-like protein